MKICLPGALALAVCLLGAQWRPVYGAQETRQGVPALPVASTVQVARSDVSASAYAAQFDKVWQTVHEHLFDRKLSGADWQQIGDSYRARLPEVKSREQFETLINRMLDELHVSHTEYYTNEDIEYYMLPAVMHGDLQGEKVAQIGIMGRRDGADYVVTGVMDGSPAEAAGIRAGDHLLTADGQPFTSAGSFEGKEGVSVQITLRREGEATNRIVRVTPVKQNVLQAFLEATRKSARVLPVNGMRLGYVHLWTMAHDAFSEALDRLVLGKLYNTDGLILDLRDGYGGHPWGFGDVFYRPDIVWDEWGHSGRSITRHTGYTKPIVVLVNGGTRSAKESFTYELKASHRALIVGSRTAGAFLGANTFPIGKDGLLELAVMGLRLDGNRLEGVGVTPDVVVAPDRTYTPQDAQLARAEQVLTDAIRRQPSRLDQRSVILH